MLAAHNRYTFGLCALLLTLAFGPNVFAAEDHLVGTYQVQGGSGYSGTAQITRNGQVYEIAWKIGAGDEFRGVGIRDGRVLSVGFQGESMSDVVSYRIEDDGRLTGSWTAIGGDGTVMLETLTKLRDR